MTTLRLLSRLTCAAVSFTCIALTASPDAAALPADYGTLQQAIVAGEAAPDLVSVLSLGGTGTTCTATLVAPNLILTAMHCVLAQRLVEGFECLSDGTIVTHSPGAGDFGQTVAPAKIAVRADVKDGKFPVVAMGKQLFTTNSSNICSNDLALVLLDRELDLPVLPLRLDASTKQGEALAIVGFGQTEKQSDTVFRRVRHGVEILAVGGDPDAPERSAAQENAFAVGQSTCPGDSGGPAISEASGAIVGVSSIVMNTCTDDTALNIFTRIAPFKGLILNAFKIAGHDPWYEGAEGPGFPAPAIETSSPDAGSDVTEVEGEDVAPARRLKTGCTVAQVSNHETPGGALVTSLAALAAGLWRRRSSFVRDHVGRHRIT